MAPQHFFQPFNPYLAQPGTQFPQAANEGMWAPPPPPPQGQHWPVDMPYHQGYPGPRMQSPGGYSPHPTYPPGHFPAQQQFPGGFPPYPPSPSRQYTPQQQIPGGFPPYPPSPLGQFPGYGQNGMGPLPPSPHHGQQFPYPALHHPREEPHQSASLKRSWDDYGPPFPPYLAAPRPKRPTPAKRFRAPPAPSPFVPPARVPQAPPTRAPPLPQSEDDVVLVSSRPAPARAPQPLPQSQSDDVEEVPVPTNPATPLPQLQDIAEEFAEIVAQMQPVKAAAPRPELTHLSTEADYAAHEEWKADREAERIRGYDIARQAALIRIEKVPELALEAFGEGMAVQALEQGWKLEERLKRCTTSVATEEDHEDAFEVLLLLYKKAEIGRLQALQAGGKDGWDDVQYQHAVKTAERRKCEAETFAGEHFKAKRTKCNREMLLDGVVCYDL